MKTKYQKFKEKLQEKTTEYKRDPHSITLIAASKYYGEIEIIKMFEQGQLDFGENRLQDAIKKIKLLNNYPLKWHFFGHIQTNKCKKIVENFETLHSVDSLKIANSVNHHAKNLNKNIHIFLQVNMAQEMNKFGFSKEKLWDDFEQINSLSNLTISGLMLITPLDISLKEKEELFKNLKILQNKINYNFGTNLNSLSMGMSNDWESALAQGATHLRIGRALFE